MLSNNRRSLTYPKYIRWLLFHARAMQFAFSEFIRTPISHFITIAIIAVTITLPLGFVVLLKNLEMVDTTWRVSTPTISLYLKTDSSPHQVDETLNLLRQRNDVASVSYVSPEEGLALFKKNTPFGDVTHLFQENPIPGVITILPNKANQDPASVNKLFQVLKELPTVDTAQADISWATRLYDIITIGEKITKGITLLFGIGVVLIISHTLRASLANHMGEIQVMRLVGATHAYIRRPLLYRGILYGFLGGATAWVFVNILLIQLKSPILRLADTYHTTFQLQLVSFPLGVELLLLTMLSGLVGAWLITTHFLSRPEQME